MRVLLYHFKTKGGEFLMQYTIITVRDKGGFIKHFGWEIITLGSIIKNRNPIATKNDSFISLKRYLMRYFKEQVTRANVKNREEIKDEK